LASFAQPAKLLVSPSEVVGWNFILPPDKFSDQARQPLL